MTSAAAAPGLKDVKPVPDSYDGVRIGEDPLRTRLSLVLWAFGNDLLIRVADVRSNSRDRGKARGREYISGETCAAALRNAACSYFRQNECQVPLDSLQAREAHEVVSQQFNVGFLYKITSGFGRIWEKSCKLQML